MAYVLLAESEIAFRDILSEAIGTDSPLETFPHDLLQRLERRRRREGFKSDPTEASQLVPYLDFQDAFDLTMRHRTRLRQDLADGLAKLSQEVSAVTAIRNRVAHNRPLEVEDLPITIRFCEELAATPGWEWNDLAIAVHALSADHGYFYQSRTHLAVDEDENAIAHNLPAPDYDETSFLGRRDERGRITKALKGSWPVISILGDGGIGKTALALQVCYDLLDAPKCPFEAIIWVTAKNSQLTSTEIIRIENTVSDSLGLFASATESVGDNVPSDGAIEALIEVLSAFPTLLVLDNVETVIDENLPTFLRDIPVGSKVLITSRIGVKTENPFRLDGLSPEDSVRLMRIIDRSRNIGLTSQSSQEQLESWARLMNFHPAYIKWFMSGVQAGRTPEQLLSDDGLLLDFCMSNVYDYLGPDAKAVLRTMVVTTGAHTMSELAFLSQLDATAIQIAMLDLTTTNFVSQVRGSVAGTTHELNDFALRYLRKTLEVSPAERAAVQSKKQQLYLVGDGLQVAHQLNPYSPDTIDVRGSGDYSAARMLREAIDLGSAGRADEGLVLCAEAAELAPGYHETARIEAQLKEVAASYLEANEAYAKARDLAPNSPYIAYFYGTFLITSGFDRARGLRELQRCANLDPSSSLVQAEVASAHIATEDYYAAMDASAFAAAAAKVDAEATNALLLLWRACSFQCQEKSRYSAWSDFAESVEHALAVEVAKDPAKVDAAIADQIFWIAEMCREGSRESSEQYVAARLAQLARTLQTLIFDELPPARRVGEVKNLTPKGFGFISHASGSHFFHASSMTQRGEFDLLVEGSVLTFDSNTDDDAKLSATSVRWVG